jgi:hypothetical protein
MTVNEVVATAMNRATEIPPISQDAVESRPNLRITGRDFEQLLQRAEEILNASAKDANR